MAGGTPAGTLGASADVGPMAVEAAGQDLWYLAEAPGFLPLDLSWSARGGGGMICGGVPAAFSPGGRGIGGEGATYGEAGDVVASATRTPEGLAAKGKGSGKGLLDVAEMGTSPHTGTHSGTETTELVVAGAAALWSAAT